jgi:hypothetical protein
MAVENPILHTFGKLVRIENDIADFFKMHILDTQIDKI